MPPVPLGLFAYKRAASFQPEVRLRNMILEEDKSGASPDNRMRLDRPGLSAFTSLGDDIRGLFRVDGLFGGASYAVSDSELYSVVSGGSTALGDVGVGGLVRWCANYQYLVILSNFTVYLYDGATVSAVTMPDDREVQDIDVLNNYIILACPDGRFYWLAPGSSVVDALDFATAESSPDGLVAARVIGDELFLLGETNSEVWQTTGDSDAPFLRASGRNFPRGCMARDTALLFDNSLFWVGNDGNLYRYSNIPTIISDPGLAQRIRERTGDLSALVVEWDGHSHYVLKIPGQGSFGYDPSVQMLNEFATYGETEWNPSTSAQIDAGTWVVGSSDSGSIWLYDSDAVTDDGTLIERIVSGTIPLMGLPARNDSVAIGAGGSDDFTLQIRWRDGQDAFPDMYDEIEIRAPADIGTLYRLGTPEQPFRTFELRIVDEVKARISGMVTGAWH